MVYIQIFGGLGNQMFQFSAAYSLARLKKTSVGICLDRINLDAVDPNYTNRQFELDRVFSIENFAFVDRLKFDYIVNPKKTIGDKIKNKLKRASFFYEKTLAYDSSLLQLTSEAYIEGYFQSQKYFEAIIPEIRRNFRFRNQPSLKTAELLEKISNLNTVAVHVRRGDFVEKKTNLQTHGACSIEYYNQASALFTKDNNVNFVVLSDDPDWVKANLNFGLNTHYVDWNTGTESWQDMLIISKCKNAIIANSSFSWWGAYLIDHPTKKIIAPKIWFADIDKQSQTQDLIPADWIRL